ncbi:hypothetical protein [Streptomyces sp. NPDC096323]|uniref:hypothetical protein n=1 Tax=Streptomyces sp. NPDC096323 TaxID=3155822 RepID=UPI0033346E82
MDATRPADTWHLSTRTPTEWGFPSGQIPANSPKGSADVPMPLPDYGVATGMRGDVRAGRPVAVTLSGTTQEWLTDSVKADAATLSPSA